MLVLIKKTHPEQPIIISPNRVLIMLVLIKKDTPRTTYYYLTQQSFNHVGDFKERHTQNNLLLSHPTEFNRGVAYKDRPKTS